ncbi:MAG: Rieske 2Fe-2S domain-containing protein [Actinomycetota bacterium]|nr:Rieske 2Fe-2S domain-containing protein [Actinomycetota bacterium]
MTLAAAPSLVALGDPAGRTAWTITHDGREFAVFLVDGAVRVTDARCPHNGGPLVEGTIREGTVVCPWHWYRFDLASGVCLTTTRYDLSCYPVIERDGQLFAEITAAPPTRSWSEILRAHARGDDVFP